MKRRKKPLPQKYEFKANEGKIFQDEKNFLSYIRPISQPFSLATLTYWIATGAIIIFTAENMLTQGGLAALQTDKKLSEMGSWEGAWQPVRDGSDLVSGLTAFIGKFMVVIAFNIQLPTQIAQFIRGCYKNRTISLSGTTFKLLNLAAMLNGAYFFAGLTKMSLDAMSPLFARYNTPAGNWLAAQSTASFMQWQFAVGGFLSNFGWYNINKFGLLCVRDIIGFCLENPAYRALREDTTRRIERNARIVLEQANSCRKKQRNDAPALTTLVKKILELDENETDIKRLGLLSLLAVASKYAKEQPQLFRKALLHVDTSASIPTTRGEFITTHGAELIAMLIGSAGFYNFQNLSEQGYQFMVDGGIISQELKDGFSPYAGAFMFAQMVLLFLITGRKTVTAAMEKLYGRDQSFSLHGNKIDAVIKNAWIVALVIGGFTNWWQNDKAGFGASVWMAVFSILAPFLTEYLSALSITNMIMDYFIFRSTSTDDHVLERQALATLHNLCKPDNFGGALCWAIVSDKDMADSFDEVRRVESNAPFDTVRAALKKVENNKILAAAGNNAKEQSVTNEFEKMSENLDTAQTIWQQQPIYGSVNDWFSSQKAKQKTKMTHDSSDDDNDDDDDDYDETADVEKQLLPKKSSWQPSRDRFAFMGSMQNYLSGDQADDTKQTKCLIA